MRHRLVLLVLIVVGIGFNTLGGARAAALPQTGVARVRFVNAGINVPALNVYADGTLWAGGIVEAVGYLDIPAGDYTFTFKLVGRPEPLASVTASLAAGDRVTVAAVNALATLEAIALFDDVSAPARNAARLKVVHAVPDVAALRVVVDGTPLADGLTFGSASDATQVFAGEHTVEVLTADGTPLVSTPGQVFEAERAYTLFVTGQLDAPHLMIASSTVLRPTADSELRFAHMIPDLGAVSVYVNGEFTPLFSQVDFSSITSYVVTGQGPHRVDLYPADVQPGEAAPLATFTATVGEHENVIFVAQGMADAPQIKAYATSLDPLPAGTSRLHVIHAAANNPAARMTTFDDVALFERIDPGEMATRVVPAGAYSLRLVDADAVDDVDDAALMMEKSGIVLASGTSSVLIICDSDPSLPLVNVVMVATDNIAQYAAVRWVHAYPAVDSEVDIYLDGNTLLNGIGYGDVVDYMLLPPQTYALSVFPAGADPNVVVPLISRTLDLSAAADAPRTMILFGELGAPRVDSVADNVDLLPEDKARVRFVNVAAGLPSFDVQNAVTEAALVQAVGYGAGSVNASQTAGAYSWRVIADGVPLLTVPEQEYAGATLYTVIVANARDGGSGLEAHVLSYVP